MKKSVLFFVLFLIGLLGGYYYMNSKKENTNQEVAQTDVQTTDEKVINVGVLQLLSHPALDSIYKGMVEELARQGYEDGKNIKIDLQNNINKKPHRFIFLCGKPSMIFIFPHRYIPIKRRLYLYVLRKIH